MYGYGIPAYGSTQPTTPPQVQATGPNPWARTDNRKLMYFAGGALLLFLLLK